MIIYKATCKINGKSYIGQTIRSLRRRISEHLLAVKNGSNYPLHNAIRKYGIENFSWEIICECLLKEDLDNQEKHYIVLFNTRKQNGYNLTDGGEGPNGWVPTEETRRKMSIAKKGKPSPRKGMKQPSTAGENNPAKRPEVRKKASEVKIGKKRAPFSAEWKKKLSIASSGENNPMWGKERLDCRGDKNPAKRPEVRKILSEKKKLWWEEKRKNV
jgi:group I intron endonuclease